MLYGLMFCLVLKYIKSLVFSYFLEKLGEKRKNEKEKLPAVHNDTEPL